MNQQTLGNSARLGTAHLALGSVTLLVATGALLLRSPVASDYDVQVFRDAAQTFLLWSLAYLVTSGLIHLCLGFALRRNPDRLSCAGLPLAAAHMVVLITTLRTAIGQPKSSIFMSGLEMTVASLSGIALLTLGVLIFQSWREFRNGPEYSDEPVLTKIYQWPLWSLLLVTAFMTAVSLARLDGVGLTMFSSQ